MRSIAGSSADRSLGQATSSGRQRGGPQTSHSRRLAAGHKRPTHHCRAQAEDLNDFTFTNEFDAYEEYDEEGRRKTLTDQGIDWRRTAAEKRSKQAATDAARREMLASQGLLSSQVMRNALEAQAREEREAKLKVEQEFAPSTLIDQLAEEGFDVEADWAALEAAKGQPTTTTQAAKQRAARLAAAAGGTPGATTQLRNAVTSELKRPPTTPQVEAMRREVQEMRARRRLWGLDSYDSASDSDDPPTRRPPPPATAPLSPVDIETRRAQRAANLLQNAEQVVAHTGVEGLRNVLNRDSAARTNNTTTSSASSEQQQQAFGLAMFASDDSSDVESSDEELFRSIAALEQASGSDTGRGDKGGKKSKEDVLTERVIDDISQIVKGRDSVPTLQRPGQQPLRTTQPAPSSRTPSSQTRAAPATAPTTPPTTRQPRDLFAQSLQSDEEALIAWLESGAPPPAAPALGGRPVLPSYPAPAASAAPSRTAPSLPSQPYSASSPAGTSKSRRGAQDEVDSFLDGLFDTQTKAKQPPAPPLLAKPNRGGVASTSGAAAGKAPQAPTSPTARTSASLKGLQSGAQLGASSGLVGSRLSSGYQGSEIDTGIDMGVDQEEDEEALFERLFAEAAAKARAEKEKAKAAAAAAVATPVPLAPPPPAARGFSPRPSRQPARSRRPQASAPRGGSAGAAGGRQQEQQQQGRAAGSPATSSTSTTSNTSTSHGHSFVPPPGRIPSPTARRGPARPQTDTSQRARQPKQPVQPQSQAEAHRRSPTARRGTR